MLYETFSVIFKHHVRKNVARLKVGFSVVLWMKDLKVLSSKENVHCCLS